MSGVFGSLEEAIKLGESAKKKADDGGVPVFTLRSMAVEDRKSKEVSYEDVVWVTIFNKGDNKNIIERPMREADKERWPDHWAAYLANEEAPLNGIDLKDFPQITPAERERCKRLQIRTVEDLVDLPENQLKQLGGRGTSLQKAAREYIAYREGVQISDLQDTIAELQKEIKELKSGNSTGDTPKRRTRNKSSEASSGDGRSRRSRRKSAPASEDGGKEA